MIKPTLLLTLLSLTSCAPKLTQERIKWAECYCGDSKVTGLISTTGTINIDCADGKWAYAYTGRSYAEGCGVLE